MKWIADTVASLVAHGAIIGAVSAIHVWTAPQEGAVEIPISFEVIEESGIAFSPEMTNEVEPPLAKPEDEEPVDEDVDVDDTDNAPEDSIMEAQEAAIEETPRQLDRQEQAPEPDPAPEPDIAPHPQPDQELIDDREMLVENEPQPKPVYDETREYAFGEPMTDRVESGLASPGSEERAKIDPAPVAIGRIVPAYPRRARRKGHEGAVAVEIEVGADGKVDDVAVVESSGYAELDESAVAAVRTASFAPATEGGKGVRGRLRLTFEFKLR